MVPLLCTVGRGGGSTDTLLINVVVEGKRELRGVPTVICLFPASMLGLGDLWNKEWRMNKERYQNDNSKNLFDRRHHNTYIQTIFYSYL